MVKTISWIRLESRLYMQEVSNQGEYKHDWQLSHIIPVERTSQMSLLSNFQLCFWDLEWDAIKHILAKSMYSILDDALKNIHWMFQLICFIQ